MSLRLVAATAALVAAFAALVLLLVPATPAPAAVAPAAVAAVETPDPVEVDPFLTALVGEGTDLDAAHAATLSEAGDLVCEGFTAEVPVAVMSATLMDLYELSGEEAMRLVNVAGETRC